MAPRPRRTRPFAWGSITKTFVAALTLRAATEGQLGLDQTIDAWLPEIPGADRITVRMLLAHRSGIFDYFQHKDYPKLVFERPDPRLDDRGDPGPQRTSGIRARAAASATPTPTTCCWASSWSRSPASRSRPSSTTGCWQPLGMDETVFQQAGQPVGLVGAKGVLEEAATGSGNGPTAPTSDPPRPTATVAWAAGAMEGSVRDLLDWEMALYGGRGADPGRARPDARLLQGLRIRPGRADPDGRGQARLRPRWLAARLLAR